jgi:hypothetical protein
VSVAPLLLRNPSLFFQLPYISYGSFEIGKNVINEAITSFEEVNENNLAYSS